MRRPTTFVLALLVSAALARAARAQDNGSPVEGADSGQAPQSAAPMRSASPAESAPTPDSGEGDKAAPADGGDAQPSIKVTVEPATPAPATAPPAAKPAAAKRRKHPAVRKAKPKKTAAPVVTPDPGVKKPTAAPEATQAPAVPVTQVQPWNP